MSVDFLPKNFPPFQVHHAKKPPRFYPDGFQRNVIDFYFIFSDCRLRKALYLQFSYFIWPLGEQDGICPGQRVNERFNFMLDLCEFYLQGGQLWIGLHSIFSPLDGLERF